jgi:signal transduction histidine kinase
VIKSVFLRRIVLLILFAVLLSGVLAAGIYILVAQRLYVDMRAEELTPIARTIADMMTDARQAGDAYGQGVWPLLNRDNKNFLGASLHIYNAQGQSLMNPQPTSPSGRGGLEGPGPGRAGPAGPGNASDLSEGEALALIGDNLQSVLSGVEVKAVCKSAAGESHLVVGVPITHNDTVVGAILFTKAMRELNDTMNGLNATLVLSALTAFVLMLVPAYFATKRLVLPIRRMQDVALAMARGDFTVRADASQKGEIGDLARAMNRFAVESERLEQIRRDYVANVSHELRTPIASVRAMGETLRDGMAKTEEKKALFYNNIVRESLRLSRLVDDLLELSRLQAGTESMQKSVFDLREVFQNIADIYSHLTVESNIRLNLSADPATPMPAYGNQDRVEQVLIILMDNAVKHTPENGLITLSCANEDEKISVCVANTGSGIPQEDLPYIFERFYKADKSHSGNGTGLGLSIANEIMKGLGESVRAENTGDGARFIFTVRREGEKINP